VTRPQEHGPFIAKAANYIVQERQARAWLCERELRLIEEGYVETALGVFTSPDGKITVER
jgi:hypothetical protein